MIEIEAANVVPAPVEEVFAFLSALENHWAVAGRWVKVVSLDADARGGRVRIHGPLGLRRTVTTRVEATESPKSIRGSATLGTTRAEVSWTLAPRAAGGTEVRLAAAVLRAGALDRALLALGAARWMRSLFAATLRRLAPAMAQPAPAPHRAAVRQLSSRLRTLPVALRGSSSRNSTSRGTL
jgi:uncharacterized protein YndB with AHSA1/START domain